MKRLIGLSALILLSSLYLQAQVAIKPTVGFNATNFSKDPETGKFKARPGYQVGGSIAIGNKVYIEPGIFYVRKSTRLSQEGDNLNNVDYSISGVQVPVALGAYFIGNQNSLFGLRGFAGGSAFFRTQTDNFDNTYVKKANWGVFAGLGADIAFLFVDAKYEWSLTNLQSEDLTHINVGKTRSIYVNAGVRIPLGAASDRKWGGTHDKSW